MSTVEPVAIAQVVRPATGGIRRHVSLLVANLDRERFIPTLFAPSDFRPDLEVPHLRQETLAISARTSLFSDLRAIRSLTRRLRAGGYGLVHAHGLRAALIGVFAARRADIPAVFTAHNLVPPVSRLQRAMLRRVFRRTKRAIVVSKAVATDLIALGMDPAYIEIIPNGIPLEPFDRVSDLEALRASMDIPATSRLVVAIGRLAPEKGFDTLVTAFSLLHATTDDIELCLVGTGPEEQKLRSLAEDFPTIHFMGYLPDVVGILQAADLVVIPSLQEGQGIVALEAMAAGKPIIASRVGGLKETILEGENGMFVPPESADTLATAMQTLLASPKRCAALGKGGRLRVEKEYTLTRMIHRIQSVYDTIKR